MLWLSQLQSFWANFDEILYWEVLGPPISLLRTTSAISDQHQKLAISILS